jgi:UDP-N-acetylmuramate dehydrogenase
MLNVQQGVPLAPHTTMHVGGPAAEFVVASSIEEIVAALDFDDQILILGGGSNLLISDSGFAGRVIKIATTGKELAGEFVEVAAGENWDEFVTWALAAGFGALAPLTGIPGTVGATPIQNVGAYGSEVSELIDSVFVYDRKTKQTRSLLNLDCKFSYRNSIFKQEPNRYVVLSVKFKLSKAEQVIVSYDELAKKLGIATGEFAGTIEVAKAVRELRASKGMLLDSADRDTYSVGSFFLNPRVSATQKATLLVDAPAWLQSDGSWKISAAWLIANSGFERGYKLGSAAISSKHTLAICNFDNATYVEIMQLAEKIKLAVAKKFNVSLQLEPTLVS